MPFYVKYYDVSSAQDVVLQVHPYPTEVDYPDRRTFEAIDTQDNNVVIQRPIHDNRRRQWRWLGYRQYLIVWSNQWTIFESLEVKARKLAGLSDVTVYIWEDESEGEGGFNETTNGAAPSFVDINNNNLKWVKVKIIQATRKTRGGGGRTTFDQAIIEFVVVDPAYTRW